MNELGVRNYRDQGTRPTQVIHSTRESKLAYHFYNGRQPPWTFDLHAFRQASFTTRLDLSRRTLLLES